ncbi:ABC transporter ATP-binding protein [Paenibacillus vini]|uniref:ABC transporter ATP-binding protein n=1 Tax=Paenibacillus vini TaxID=1476024 RepID=UPI0025B6C862|nr:ABC transporter ATP-binding protein [Paenibacillus vini]MDN4069260.1 ABC transporter ATP-binding protein [Paenibacillus vini]MDN4069313.1 ABC transporter ATP-binding protein [Paenibacillus vini]
MNVRRYRLNLERTYTDRVIVKRMDKVKVNGETKQQLITVYDQQPCRLSQKVLGANGQTETVNKITYDTKLFIAPELEIKQGDTLKVTRGRNTTTGWEAIAPGREYKAGEPFIYESHQEISIQRDGNA